MYQVAKRYPQLVHYLDKYGYLERAYGTALAFYTYPWQIARWSANELGNYNELVIADLIAELEAIGWQERAQTLRRFWEAKGRIVHQRPAGPLSFRVFVRPDLLRIDGSIRALCTRAAGGH